MNVSEADNLSKQHPNLKRLVILTAAVCTVVVFVHWPALSAKALSFDDNQYLTENPLVQIPALAQRGDFSRKY